MNLRILAFGVAQEMVGGPVAEVQLPGTATVRDLRQLLLRQFPPLGQLASFLIAVNHAYAGEDQPIGPGDEIALIPPVSGG
ncbi:MAG TPA: MoaD/ThiS family protein [Chitinophagaceae bacterium]|nr:MoaD/ThiS family protein [Chitinophagaceae bacterium]